MKLKIFDKTLLETVRSGKNDIAEIINDFNIDEKEFQKRLKLLEKNKLLVESEGKLKLGIKGFEEIEKEKRKTKNKKQDEKNEENQKSEKEIVQKKLDVEKIDVVDDGKIEKMDLSEIVKKYGPTEEQKKIFEKKIEASKKTEENEKTSKEEERCALCRQPFELSVKDSSKARYGYCFCGAAYHKDCYESLLESSGLCVNCGKKLVLILDKQTKDALKNVKNIFT